MTTNKADDTNRVSNIRMYTLLRTIQTDLRSNPCTQVGDCIAFEDVLGRTKSLPYEYFRHYDASFPVRFAGASQADADSSYSIAF